MSLLKEADFNPDAIIAEEEMKNARDRDLAKVSKLRSVWNFLEKETGNYLANKFFEAGEFFNAYRIYTALIPIDETPTWRVPSSLSGSPLRGKIRNFVQATETYISIEELFDNDEDARSQLAQSKYLKFVYGMSKWRREQLEGRLKSDRQSIDMAYTHLRPQSASPDQNF